MEFTASRSRPEQRSRSITAPAILLGVGLGGFVDGIALHQVLQWHHMLTAIDDYPATTVAGLEVNTLWDGVFHALSYVCVAIGLFWVWARARRGGVVWTWRHLLGWLFVGWGIFNLVEGVIDHHILRLHHVRAGPNELAYDLAFLAIGLILAVAGWVLAKSERPSETPLLEPPADA
jgi:uncharacterized membrane protein